MGVDEAGGAGQLVVLAAGAVGGGDDFELEAAGGGGESGAPDGVGVAVEGELVEDDVAGEAAHRVRVGGQGDDAGAVGQAHRVLLELHPRHRLFAVLGHGAQGAEVMSNVPHGFERLPLGG